MEIQRDFSTKLIDLLEEEAQTEANLEKVLRWANNSQWEEDNVNYWQQSWNDKHAQFEH